MKKKRNLRTKRRCFPILSLCLLALLIGLTGIPPAAVTAAAPDSAASNPLLTERALFEAIAAHIDIEYGNQLAKEVSLVGTGELGFRTAGSKGEKEAAAIIEKAMKELGLSNVRQDPVPVHSWDFGKGELMLRTPESKSISLSSYAGSAGTPSGGISGDIVYIGDGSLSGYAGQDVKGKIVLAEFCLNDDYWITQPSYQAELKGAKAMIVLYSGTSYGVRADTLNSFDIISRDTIPVMNISRADGAYLKEQIAKGPVSGTLISDAVIDKNGRSANVIGEIPGVMKDQYIVFGAHYDGYFHAYQDDILGVGIFMSIAKAIRESGYQPQHTLIFTAFGSEEYGITDSHYDWIRGSWYQINHNTPELAGKTTMFLNFDTQRPDMKEFVINVIPEYRQFFERYILSLDLPEPWVDGARVAGTNGPWSDDYNYISKGIPGLISGKGNTQWRSEAYHTNLDDHTVYNPITFRFNTEHYLAMMLAFDQLILPPLNFDSQMQSSLESLSPEVLEAAGLSADEFIRVSRSWMETSAENYRKILQANQIYDRLRTAVAAEAADPSVLAACRDLLMPARTTLFEALRLMEQEFTKLDTWDVVSYGHEIAQNDYSSIRSALTQLKQGNAQDALEALTGTQFGWILPAFEKEVYRYWGIEAINPQREDLYWGTGKTLQVIDLYDVYQAIQMKSGSTGADFAAEIQILEEKLQEAAAALKATLEQETDLVRRAAATTDAPALDAAVLAGEEALQSAYASLPAALRYADLPQTHQAFDTITGLRLQGVLKDDDHFRPDTAVTRAEFAGWLTEAFRLPSGGPATVFSDVDPAAAYAGDIAAVAAAGIMTGNGDGTFLPDRGLTKAQMTAVADKLLAFGNSAAADSGFTDVSMNRWYGPLVAQAAAIGLVSGDGDGSFAPEREITRAEAAQMLETLLRMK